jgi:hypothetical protein
VFDLEIRDKDEDESYITALQKSATRFKTRAALKTAGAATSHYVGKLKGAGEHAIFETLGRVLGEQAFLSAAEQCLGILSSLESLVALKNAIGTAIEFKKSLELLYADYEKEAVLGPLMDVRYLMCKSLSNMHKFYIESQPESSAEDQAMPAMNLYHRTAQILYEEFNNPSSPLKCTDFVSYPAAPAGAKPLCRVFAPATWKFAWPEQASALLQVSNNSRGDQEEARVLLSRRHGAHAYHRKIRRQSNVESVLTRKDGAVNTGDGTGETGEYAGDYAWVETDSLQPPIPNGTSASASLSETSLSETGLVEQVSVILDGDAKYIEGQSAGEVCGKPKIGLGGNSIQYKWEAGTTPKMCECDMPITSFQQMYGTKLNEKNGFLFKQAKIFKLGGFDAYSNRAVVTTGHFGMRLFTPIIIGDLQSAQLKQEEMKLRDSSLSDLSQGINQYCYEHNPYQEDLGEANVVQAYNFLGDPNCKMEPGPGATEDLKCGSGGGKQGFILQTYAKGAPVVAVKPSCTEQELQDCQGGAQFKSCGWRRIPKIKFPNTEPGVLSYCFLKAWHVEGLTNPTHAAH